MPGARAAAIKAFAAAVDKGDVPIDGRLPLDELIAAITAVPGLGPWTAGYLALRMGEADAFPASRPRAAAGGGARTASRSAPPPSPSGRRRGARTGRPPRCGSGCPSCV